MKRKPKTRRNPAKSMHRYVAVGTLVSVYGALTPNALANVVGADTQNFNATTSGLDFVTVESAETLQPGFVNFGLFMNYAVNTLPYFEKSETVQSRTKFNDTLLGADINVGYGVAKNLDLGLSAPQVVTSSVKTKSWNGKFRDNGNTEVRANAKYKLTGDEKSGVAIQGLVNVNRTKDNPYVGDTSAPIYSVVLIGSMKATDDMGLGLNLGYRWRKPGAALPDSDPIKPLRNQYIWSAAMNYRMDSLDSKFIAEVFGSSPVNKTDTNNDRNASSTEGLIGFKHDLDTNMAVHGGVGTELSEGMSSPDWRVYAGINYSMGPKFDQPARVTAQEPPVTQTQESPFAGEPKAFEKIVVHDIMFEFDSDHMVLGKAKSMLNDLADHLNKPPAFTKLVIIGHTDSIGSEEYNDQLSKRRSETIRRWLNEELKIDAAKIVAEGRGEREPISSNGNFQGRQLNRRVEFRIYRDGEKEEARSQANPKAAENAKDPVADAAPDAKKQKSSPAKTGAGAKGTKKKK